LVDRRRILTIEDESPMRKFIRATLNAAEYEFIEARTGRQGLRMATSENPQVILLDLGLPDMDGVDVVKGVREWSKVPIIVLSARDDVKDKVSALDAGADDYLTKPCLVDELLARLRVVFRRTAQAPEVEETIFEVGGVQINFGTSSVFRNGTRVKLTRTEYRLLALLARNPGGVLTHKQLLTHVWGEKYEVNHHYLRVYMNQIRQKIEEDSNQPKLILSEYGIGYRLNVD